MNALLAMIPANTPAPDVLFDLRVRANGLDDAALLATLGLTAEKHGRNVLLLTAEGEVHCILKPAEVRRWTFGAAVNAAHEAWIEANTALVEEAPEIVEEAPVEEQLLLAL